MFTGGHIHIIGSGETRNGKTLLARLVTDFVLLAGGEPALYDTDIPHGRLFGWYPRRTRIVDLRTTHGQIAVFDHILDNPESDHVIDLSARDLVRFFSLVEQTGFVAEADRQGFDINLMFVLDRPDVTLATLRAIRVSLDGLRVIPVFNEGARGHARFDLSDDATTRMAEIAELRLPRLDREMLRTIEPADFSFAQFLAENTPELRSLRRTVLRGLLRTVFGQFQDLGLVAGATALKRAHLA